MKRCKKSREEREASGKEEIKERNDVRETKTKKKNGRWKKDAQVNSPVQNRAYQQVSMYHRLLIASQYLATWFPPLYRPHLPPLHLPHPEGDKHDNFAVASRSTIPRMKFAESNRKEYRQTFGREISCSVQQCDN